MTEDEMVGWHHRRYGHEFEQALEVGGNPHNFSTLLPFFICDSVSSFLSEPGNVDSSKFLQSSFLTLRKSTPGLPFYSFPDTALLPGRCSIFSSR